MKRAFAILCACFALACHAEDAPALAEVTVHFSPRGGAEAEVVRQIAAARSRVRVECYSFTSKPIIAALIAAGVTVLLDGKHPIAHNKVAIIDSLIVLTGSFNYTFQGEHSNAENLITMRNPALAALYLRDWEAHAAHSVQDKPTPSPPTK